MRFTFWSPSMFCSFFLSFFFHIHLVGSQMINPTKILDIRQLDKDGIKRSQELWQTFWTLSIHWCQPEPVFKAASGCSDQIQRKVPQGWVRRGFLLYVHPAGSTKLGNTAEVHRRLIKSVVQYGHLEIIIINEDSLELTGLHLLLKVVKKGQKECERSLSTSCFYLYQLLNLILATTLQEGVVMCI